MKKIIPLFLSIVALAISGCDLQSTSRASSKHEHAFINAEVSHNADKRAYIVGSQFNVDGLKMKGTCSICHEKLEIGFYIENGDDLELGQESVIIHTDAGEVDYPIKVSEKYHIACVGDSLTAGHYWANESYPTKLATSKQICR